MLRQGPADQPAEHVAHHEAAHTPVAFLEGNKAADSEAVHNEGRHPRRGQERGRVAQEAGVGFRLEEDPQVLIGAARRTSGRPAAEVLQESGGVDVEQLIGLERGNVVREGSMPDLRAPGRVAQLGQGGGRERREGLGH